MANRMPITRKVATKYPRSTKPLAIEPAELREFVKAIAETAHKDEGEGRKGEPAFKEGEGVDWPVGDTETEPTKE